LGWGTKPFPAGCQQLAELATVWQGTQFIASAPAVIALVMHHPVDPDALNTDEYDLGQATYPMMLAATDPASPPDTRWWATRRMRKGICPACGGSPGFGSRGCRRPEVDWQSLRDRLAPLRTRWDVAILVNLAESQSPVRPADLIKAINAQSVDGRISWKVLEARVRRLEAVGYVAREEVPHVPRETRY
jgi:DNA-binding HxlR family transcriptional regulator